MTDRLIRRKEVEHLTGMSRSFIYAGISSKTFPKPMRVGKRAVAWPISQIENWIFTKKNDF